MKNAVTLFRIALAFVCDIAAFVVAVIEFLHGNYALAFALYGASVAFGLSLDAQLEKADRL